MRWRKKLLKNFSSLYYTNFTAAKVWQENEKNYSVIPMNWPVFPKYHPGHIEIAGFQHDEFVAIFFVINITDKFMLP